MRVGSHRRRRVRRDPPSALPSLRRIELNSKFGVFMLVAPPDTASLQTRIGCRTLRRWTPLARRFLMKAFPTTASSDSACPDTATPLPLVHAPPSPMFFTNPCPCFPPFSETATAPHLLKSPPPPSPSSPLLMSLPPPMSEGSLSEATRAALQPKYVKREGSVYDEFGYNSTPMSSRPSPFHPLNSDPLASVPPPTLPSIKHSSVPLSIPLPFPLFWSPNPPIDGGPPPNFDWLTSHW